MTTSTAVSHAVHRKAKRPSGSQNIAINVVDVWKRKKRVLNNPAGVCENGGPVVR